MDLSLEEYMLQYKGYAVMWANYYNHIFSDNYFEYDDLYQASCLALIDGYYKYDNSKSSLGTYTYLTAKYGIIKYIRKNSSVTKIPGDLLVAATNLSKKNIEYYRKHGKNMDLEDMINYAKKECYTGSYRVDSDFIKTLLKIEAFHLKGHNYSLEDKIDNYNSMNSDKTENIYLKDCLPSRDNTEKTAINNNMIEQILKYLEDNFSEIDVEIFKETLGLIDEIPKTRRELSKKYNVSYQTIDIRYKKTLKKIQKNFNN